MEATAKKKVTKDPKEAAQDAIHWQLKVAREMRGQPWQCCCSRDPERYPNGCVACLP